jgi:hypothetical protein
VRGKGTKLGKGCPKVRLSQDRMPNLSPHLAYSEGKGTKLGEGEGARLGEGYPKVRLSQDRMPIFPPYLA